MTGMQGARERENMAFKWLQILVPPPWEKNHNDIFQVTDFIFFLASPRQPWRAEPRRVLQKEHNQSFPLQVGGIYLSLDPGKNLCILEQNGRRVEVTSLLTLKDVGCWLSSEGYCNWERPFAYRQGDVSSRRLWPAHSALGQQQVLEALLDDILWGFLLVRCCKFLLVTTVFPPGVSGFEKPFFQPLEDNADACFLLLQEESSAGICASASHPFFALLMSLAQSDLYN